MDFGRTGDAGKGVSFIVLSSSSDSDDGDGEDDDSVSSVKRSRRPEEIGGNKKTRPDGVEVVLPEGFLDPLPPARSSSTAMALSGPVVPEPLLFPAPAVKPAAARQFWKAGDYEKDAILQPETTSDSSPEHLSSRGRSKAFSLAVGGSRGQSTFTNSEESHSRSNGKEFKGGRGLRLVLSDDEEHVNAHSEGRLGNRNMKCSTPTSLNKAAESALRKPRASGYFDKTGKLEKSQTCGAGDCSHPIGDDGDPDISCSPVEGMDDVNAAGETQMGEARALSGRSDSAKNLTSRAAERQYIANLQIHNNASYERPNLSKCSTAVMGKSHTGSVKRLEDQNHESNDRLAAPEEKILRACQELQSEMDKIRTLEAQYKQKLEEARKEQESLIDIFSEERIRRDREEETLRNKLKEAYTTIQELLQKQGVK